MGYTREFYELHNGVAPGEPEHGCKGGSEYYDHVMGYDRQSSDWDYSSMCPSQADIDRYRD